MGPTVRSTSRFDALPRCALAVGVAEVEELADIVAAAVGVPDQGQGQRQAERPGDRAAGCAAEAVGQLTPTGGRRVALDAGQVIRGYLGTHVLQFEDDGPLQELLAGGGRHLVAPAQDDDPEVRLVAERPQRERPELFRDLIEPVQDRRDPGRPHQLGCRLQAPLPANNG